MCLLFSQKKAQTKESTKSTKKEKEQKREEKKRKKAVVFLGRKREKDFREKTSRSRSMS